MTVPSKTLRLFLCFALAVALGAFGNLARAAVFYNAVFDPEFTGTVTFSIDDICLAQPDGIYPIPPSTCDVDLVFADIVDSFGNQWTGGPQSDVAIEVVIAGNELIALATGPMFLSGKKEDCDGTGVLQFSAFSTDLEPGATFTCGTVDTNTYILARAPEPGTLGLIVGALGAGWLARRRRARA
jgi:hypothetical protein